MITYCPALRPTNNIKSFTLFIAAEAEAEGSLSAALEMKRQGKADKALKLFEHAYILAPLHPDILNHYGEFLEDTKKDIIMADQLYFQVINWTFTDQFYFPYTH